MTKRICWKKGMRLTDEILRASDNARLELISKTLVLGSVGRFGLFPSLRPFSISLNIGKENLDVESLNCLAITKEGGIIDVNYSARYDNTLETSIPFPNHLDADELYLTIEIVNGQWKEVSNDYEEPLYQFKLITPNNPLANNALPIARMVNSEYGGWHVDDIDFVPPCLYIWSHIKYEELYNKFLGILSEMSEKVRVLINSEARNAMRTFLPQLQQIMIETDKGRELMTPMSFLGLIQRFVCTFTTSCELDENISLSDSSYYWNYAFSPYTVQNSYQRAKEGLEICFAISEKTDRIQANKPEPKPTIVATPFVSNDQLFQNCRNKNVTITVSKPTDNATVYYSIDGSEPTQKLASNSSIVMENGFNKQKAPEPDKTVTIKLKAVADGVSSEVSTYTITMHKDYKVWDGYEI